MRALAVLLLACALAAGCASGGFDASSVRPSLAPQAALDQIVLGKSSKADVTAAVGEATRIPFDSGYEVWVYRWPGAAETTRAATELVLLFPPSGPVSKARLRPGCKGADGPCPAPLSL